MLIENVRHPLLYFFFLSLQSIIVSRLKKNDQIMSNLNSCVKSVSLRNCDEGRGTDLHKQGIKKSVVVTFVWRNMNEKEKSAFCQGVKILGKHPFVVIHPQSYSVDYLLEQHEGISSLALPDEHFQSVSTYNSMMLSPWFYQLFSEFDYMLVYQLDAYVFSDQLDYWTSMDYDYIGAPWMPNDTKYERLIGQWILRLLKHFPIRNGQIHSAHLFHQVGNGGFSLRRIAKMQEILERNQEMVKTTQGKHARQEDVFISVLLKEKEHLKIPNYRLAMYFAFEKAPAWCLEFTGGVFPFGCHNFNGRYWDSFWKYHIPIQK